MAGTVVHARNPRIGEADTGGLWGSPASPSRETGRVQLCRRHFPQRRWTTFLRRTPQGCSLASPAPACTYICEHTDSHACIPHTLLTLGRKSPNTQPQARAVLSMERRRAGIRYENWSSASPCLSGKASHTPPANSLAVYTGTEDACYQAVPLGLKFHFRSQHLQPFFFLVYVSCGKSEEKKSMEHLSRLHLEGRK